MPVRGLKYIYGFSKNPMHIYFCQKIGMIYWVWNSFIDWGGVPSWGQSVWSYTVLSKSCPRVHCWVTVLFLKSFSVVFPRKFLLHLKNGFSFPGQLGAPSFVQNIQSSWETLQTLPEPIAHYKISVRGVVRVISLSQVRFFQEIDSTPRI